jgi:hypothetical protein
MDGGNFFLLTLPILNCHYHVHQTPLLGPVLYQSVHLKIVFEITFDRHAHETVLKGRQITGYVLRVRVNSVHICVIHSDCPSVCRQVFAENKRLLSKIRIKYIMEVSG